MKSLSTKLFEQGIKKRDLELEINQLFIQKEKLQQNIVELSNSNTDLLKKPFIIVEEYKEIKKEKLQELEKEKKEIKTIKKNKEKIQEEYNRLLENNKLLSILVKEKEKYNEILLKTQKELEKERDEIIIQINKEKQKVNQIIIDFVKKEAEYTKEIKKKEIELNKLKEEIKEEREKIHQDNKLLTIRQNDLYIFEKRLQKKYPNEKIII